MEGYNASGAKTDNPFKDLNFEIFTQYQSLIYILTVPFSAFGSWLAYYLLRERTYNFTEHLVINLYYYAQYIIITAVLSILFLFFKLDYLIISTLVTIPTLVYFFYVLKRIFKNSFWETLARFLFVMVIYVFSMFIIMLFVVALVILYLYITHK